MDLNFKHTFFILHTHSSMDSRGSIAPRQLRYVVVEDGTVIGQEVASDGRMGLVTSVRGVHALVAFKRA